jgi:tetratricopeptide (TPR) repeat protein
MPGMWFKACYSGLGKHKGGRAFPWMLRRFLCVFFLLFFSNNALACSPAPNPMYDHSGYATWCQCIGGEIYTAPYGGPACRISGVAPPPRIIFQTDSSPEISAETEAFLHAYNLAQGDKEDAAIAAYRKAIKFNNKYAAAYNNLGLIYKGRGRYQKAIDLYRQAIKYAEEDIDWERARGNMRVALLEQGYCYSKGRKTAKAKASFQSVLAMYPGDAEARQGLNRVHAKETNSELPQYLEEHGQCPTKVEGK